MCYTDTRDIEGLRFFISNCFGFGFDWEDTDFIEAVKNRDERLWKILEWAANGGAEQLNDAASFEEYVDAYRGSGRELAAFLSYETRDGRNLDELLNNPYLSDNARQQIIEYKDGTLARRVKEERSNDTPHRNSIVGYVYLIRAENGLYKFGKTRDMKARLKPFGVNFPMKWDLVHSFQSNDYSLTEERLHQMFRDKREIGEWFKLLAEDVAHITAIKDGGL
jgi:hypothetical protein